MSWGEAGEDDGAFLQPFGIAAGVDGFVYVTDSATHRIQKFTEDGEFVKAWGEFGTDHGQMWKPKDIGQDERNRLIVVDRGNHRGQIFSPEGDWMVSFGLGRSYTPEKLRRMKKPAPTGG